MKSNQTDIKSKAANLPSSTNSLSYEKCREILEIPANIELKNDEDTKRVIGIFYKKAMLKYHADKNPDNKTEAEEISKYVATAKAALCEMVDRGEIGVNSTQSKSAKASGSSVTMATLPANQFDTMVLGLKDVMGTTAAEVYLRAKDAGYNEEEMQSFVDSKMRGITKTVYNALKGSGGRYDMQVPTDDVAELREQKITFTVNYTYESAGSREFKDSTIGSFYTAMNNDNIKELGNRSIQDIVEEEFRAQFDRLKDLDRKGLLTNVSLQIEPAASVSSIQGSSKPVTSPQAQQQLQAQPQQQKGNESWLKKMQNKAMSTLIKKNDGQGLP